MKIYSIIIYPSKLKATLHEGKSQEKTIEESIYPLSQWVKPRCGTHHLKTADNVFYVHMTPEKTAIVASNIEMNTEAQQMLFEKVTKAQTTKDLERLIAAPDEAIKTKAQVILKEINEAKQKAMEIMQKLQTKQEKIEQLKNSTDQILINATQFKKKSQHLQNSLFQSGLFFMNSMMVNFFKKTATNSLNFKRFTQ